MDSMKRDARGSGFVDKLIVPRAEKKIRKERSNKTIIGAPDDENASNLSGGIATAGGIGASIIGALDTDPNIGAADYAKNGISMAATGATVGGPIGAGVGLAVGLGMTAFQQAQQEELERQKNQAQGLAIGQARAGMQGFVDGGEVKPAPVKIKESGVYDPYALMKSMRMGDMRKGAPIDTSWNNPVDPTLKEFNNKLIPNQGKIDIGIVGDPNNLLPKDLQGKVGMFKGGQVTSPNVEKGKQAVNRQGLAVGGPVEGAGTGTSDDVEAKLNPGDFVVPASNAKIAEQLRQMYFGQSDEVNHGDKKGTAPVALSNGEHVFTKAEADVLKQNGINLDMLAPNAEKTGYGYYKGGKVGNKKVQHLAPGGTVKKPEEYTRNQQLIVDTAIAKGITDKDTIDYLLAIADHESKMGGTMKEINPGQKGNDGNYADTAYTGRGFVQLTHKENYQKATDYFKSQGKDYDLVKNPELANDPKIAAEILIEGSKEGWFTGKKLGDAMKSKDPADVYRIINPGASEEMITQFKESYNEINTSNPKYTATPTQQPSEKEKRTLDSGGNPRGRNLPGIQGQSYTRNQGGGEENVLVQASSGNGTGTPKYKAGDLHASKKRIDELTKKLKDQGIDPVIDWKNYKPSDYIESSFNDQMKKDFNALKDELNKFKDVETENKHQAAIEAGKAEGRKRAEEAIAAKKITDPGKYRATVTDQYGRNPSEDDQDARQLQEGNKSKGEIVIPAAPEKPTPANYPDLIKNIKFDPNKIVPDNSEYPKEEGGILASLPDSVKDENNSDYNTQRKGANFLSNAPTSSENEDPEVSLFSKLGEYGGLFALGQTAMGLAGLASSKDPGTYPGDPNLSTQLGQAQLDATRLNPAVRANAETNLELTRRTRNAEASRMSAGDVGLAMGASRESAIDKNRGIMGLAQLEEQTQQSKLARVDQRVDALSADKGKVWDSKNQRFIMNQEASAGLLNTGITNFIGAQNYSKYMRDLGQAQNQGITAAIGQGFKDLAETYKPQK